MKSSIVTYFSLKPRGTFSIHSNLHYQAEHDEVFISSHLRICGFNKMACISSRELAERFREAILPQLQKRYGEDFDIFVSTLEESSGKKLTARITSDSAIIAKRLETENFAGNVSP